MTNDQASIAAERGSGAPGSRRAPAPSVRSLFEVKHYAIVVGIDAYDTDIGPLSGAVADARAVAAVLSDETRTDRFAVTLLTDEAATREGIKAAFRDLRAKLAATPDARVLLYYAGHGVSATASEDVKADTPGYFLPQDARHGDVRTYLSMADVRSSIDELRCHHMLLVLDCCFAGAFRWCATRASSPSPRVLYEERVRRYLRDPAWHVITSAAYDERALDSVDGRLLIAGTRQEGAPPEDGHVACSPFAVALVKALRGDADSPVSGKLDPDGVITGSEIHVYISNLFRSWGEASARSFQIPLFFHWPTREGNKGEFVFLNPARALDLKRAVELVEANNPYRGLEAYAYEPRDPAQPARRPRLFGRDALTKELVAKVKAQPVVAVLGASGSGKSSLVCAGALPALEDEGWSVVAVVRPGEEPMTALRALTVALERCLAERPDAKGVAVVDQLEELVTMRRGADERAAFFGAVDEAVAASGGRLRVVYTLRSDFEPHFTKALRAQPPPEGRLRVLSMSQDDLRAVIERPAEACVFSFDPPTLVDEIAKEVVGAPGALPLVSFTLSEMYLRYASAFSAGTRDDRALTRADYEALGGVEGSLGKQADRVYDGLPDDATRDALRRVMLRMVTLEGGLPARRRVLESELGYADADDTARARTALDALTKARLVVRGDQDGEACAEPAHDKIVLGWPRLREWIDAPGERERMEAHRLVREKAADWRRLGRKGGWLDRDARLDRWAELLGGVLNADEAALLNDSVRRRREETEREKQRVAELEAALVRARDQAKMSAAREASNDPTTQVALLREVARPETTLGWVELAQQALSRPIAPVVRYGYENPFATVAFSPDRTRLLTVSGDGTMRVWSADGIDTPVELHGSGPGVLGAAFSCDAAHFFTASRDGMVRRYRADGSGEPKELQLAMHELVSADFSRDGARVVTTAGNLVNVWRSDTGEQLAQRTYEGEVTTARLSPDGEFVLTCHSPPEKIRASEGEEESEASEGEEESEASEGEEEPEASEGEEEWNEWKVSDVSRWRVDGMGEPVRYEPEKRVGICLSPMSGPDVYHAEFSLDGHRVLMRRGNLVCLWSADGTGEPFVCEPDMMINDAACSPRWPWVLTGASTGVAEVHHAAGSYTDGVRRAVDGNHEAICFVAFSPDDAWALAVSSAGTMWVWRTEGAFVQVELRGHEASAAVFCPDSAGVLMACRDGAVRVWRFDRPEPLRGWYGEGQVLGAVLRPDGLKVVTVNVNEGAFVRGSDGEPVELPGQPVEVVDWGREHGFTRAVLSHDGTRLLTHCADLPEGDHKVQVSPIGGVGEAVVLQGDIEGVLSAGFSRDDRHVVAALSDGTVRVWSATDGAEEARFTPSETVTWVACSRDGRLVAIVSGGRAQVWSVGSHEPVGEYCPEDGKVSSADFSPDDERVVSVVGKTARVWRLDRASEPLVLPHRDVVNLAAFSPQGTRVVTASGNTARVWRASDGRESMVLRGHEGDLFFAMFTPDGAHLITSSHDPAAESTLSAFPYDAVSVWAIGTERVLDLLWEATSCCLPPDERVRRLNETPAEALAHHAAQVALRDARRASATRPRLLAAV